MNPFYKEKPKQVKKHNGWLYYETSGYLGLKYYVFDKIVNLKKIKKEYWYSCYEISGVIYNGFLTNCLPEGKKKYKPLQYDLFDLLEEENVE